MNELDRQVADLRLRLRLQMLLLIGILIAGLFALGARDGAARNAAGTATPSNLVLTAQSAPAVEEDAFRLTYASPTTIVLRGTGRNGGTVNIDGTLYSFPADIVFTPNPMPATLVYAYAYVIGTAVTVEISTTVPTSNQYGKYATKTGDASRRYLGMAYMDGYGHFTPDLFRSVKNELGYAFTKKVAPATPYEAVTSSASWTALAPGGFMSFMCFEGERVHFWVKAMNYVAPNFTSRSCHLGIVWMGVPSTVDDSETVVSINRGTAWALPWSLQSAEACYTATNGGIQEIQACHRGDGTTASDFYISSYYPAQLGFEVLH